MGKVKSMTPPCTGSLRGGLWRRRGAFIQLGPSLFLTMEGKDRGFALHHSSALPLSLALELAVGEICVQG